MLTANDHMSGYVFPKLKKREILRHCEILATGVYYPENRVTNQDIVKEAGFRISPDAVEASLGTKERRVAPKDCTDSDLLLKAAQVCLKKAGVKGKDLSKILVNKFLGDRALPMTASFLQDKLDCPSAVHALDVDGGINSFLQALEMARNLINIGDGYILIVSGGLIHCLTDPENPASAFSFGDGAAAVLLGPSDKEHILSSYFFSGAQYVELITGFSVLNQFRGADFLKQADEGQMSHVYENGNWLEAEEFILAGMEETVKQLLADSALSLEEMDYFIITENHRALWLHLIDKLGVDRDRCISLIGEYGNTLSAMVPSMLNEVFTREDGIKKGNKVMILSIGEGINAGGMIYRV